MAPQADMQRTQRNHSSAVARCKSRGDCRTILSMKVIFLASAAAAALTLVGGVYAQSQQTSDTTAVVKNDARTAGHAVANSATAVGHSVAETSRHAGHAVAEGTRSTRDTIRDDSKKVGHAVADSARSVGHSVKEGAGKVKAAVSGKPSEPEPKS